MNGEKPCSARWSNLIAEHGAVVWRTIYRLLNHHADAKDCYQETFLAAWRFASRRQVAEWKPFLISLASRRAIDRLRQRYRLRARFQNIDSLVEPISGDGAPDEQLRAAELMERVRQQLGQLPRKQAHVFWLSCIEELTHEEIGVLTGASPGAVRVLLHRARARIAAALEHQFSPRVSR